MYPQRAVTPMFKMLSNRSGSSLLFVLGIMLMLMIIGISAMVAASAAAGSGINQQVNTQLNLYADNLQKTIKASLNGEEANVPVAPVAYETIAGPVTLGGQLLGIMYNDIPNDYINDTERSIVLPTPADPPTEITATLGDGMEDYTATVKIDIYYKARIKEEVPYEPEKPREPKSVSIRATVFVTVNIAHTSGKSTNTTVKYDFTNGYLDDDKDIDEAGPMTIRTPGTWRVAYG